MYTGIFRINDISIKTKKAGSEDFGRRTASLDGGEKHDLLVGFYTETSLTVRK